MLLMDTNKRKPTAGQSCVGPIHRYLDSNLRLKNYCFRKGLLADMSSFHTAVCSPSRNIWIGLDVRVLRDCCIARIANQ